MKTWEGTDEGILKEKGLGVNVVMDERGKGDDDNDGCDDREGNINVRQDVRKGRATDRMAHVSTHPSSGHLRHGPGEPPPFSLEHFLSTEASSVDLSVSRRCWLVQISAKVKADSVITRR
ncbi:hypothetical protein E2C01_026374 [Portunus trituberculatus]|uniref:Uncharacterized protein n=1 Tax=Portunus trituberculatus TaxID=210409 RepID=A0A5B7EHZ6_PORTR|nr:hypothetical protein [Portunus trituberculatus]